MAASPPASGSLSAVAAICLPASLVFSAGVGLSILLPWRELSGLANRDGLLLLVVVLLLVAFLGWCFTQRTRLELAAVLGSGTGTLVSLVLLAELTSTAPPAAFGLWFGWMCSWGVWAPLLVVGWWQPLPWPEAERLAVPFWVRRYAALLLAQGVALVLGVLYWLVAVWV